MFWMRRRHVHAPRGAASLLAVMFMAFFAVTTALMMTVQDQVRLGHDRWRMAGQIWAEWVHALDRIDIPATAPWGGDWTSVRALYCDRDGNPACSLAELAALPASGLGEDLGRVYGIPVAAEELHFSYVEVPTVPGLTCRVSSGTGTCAAPACECERVGAVILRPRSLGRLNAIRRGAVDGGLRAVAVAGPGSGDVLQGADAIAAFEDELEDRLPSTWTPRVFAAGDLVAVAHLSIPYNERALYRRAPPGRPDLAGMLTTLNMGGENITIEGEPPAGVAPEDSPDVEVDNIEGVVQATVNFKPVPGDYEPAVRADFVVAASLTLRPRGHQPHQAHAIGIRGSCSGAADDDCDEVLIIEGTAEVKQDLNVETGCKYRDEPERRDVDERCVATQTLSGGILESRGPLKIDTNKGGVTKDSGVVAREMHADTLDLSGECHGCTGFEPPP